MLPIYLLKRVQTGLSKWPRIYRLFWRIYCRLFGPGGGVLQISLSGSPIRFYVHSQSFANQLTTFDHEKNVLISLIQNIRPGDCVWDIGAEIGLYTFFLAQAVGDAGEIVAFEPENKSYARLVENVRLNNFSNIRVCKKALGEHSGQAELFVGRAGMAPGLTLSSGNDNTVTGVQDVAVSEGDRLVEEDNLPAPKAIKIDVEGYEHSVIRGLMKTLRSSSCRIVCCEIHPMMLPDGITDVDVINLLKSYGFNKIETFARNETYHVLCSKK